MKPGFLLGLSIAGNIALVTMLTLTPPAPIDATVRADRGRAAVLGNRQRETAVASAARSAGGNRWSELNRDDAPTLVLRLRAAGFPPEVVKAIVKATVLERFGRRLVELSGEADLPYWQQRGPRDAATMREIMSLRFQRERAIVAALGRDGLTDDDEISRASSAKFDVLPPEKSAAVAALVDAAIQRQIAARPFERPYLPTDTATYRRIEQDLQRAIAQVMTPAEYDEFQLRNGIGASRARSAIDSGFFEPTEQEYRTIARAYQTAYTGLDPDFGPEATRAAIEAQVQAQLKVALGADRYAEWETAATPEAQRIGEFVRRLDLPSTTAREVLKTQQDFDQRVHAIETDETAGEAVQKARYAALLAEAEAKFSNLLGARGYYGYRQGPGKWIGALEKRKD